MSSIFVALPFSAAFPMQGPGDPPSPILPLAPWSSDLYKDQPNSIFLETKNKTIISRYVDRT